MATNIMKQRLPNNRADELEKYVVYLLKDYNCLKAQSILEEENLCVPQIKDIGPVDHVPMERTNISDASNLVRVIEISYNALTKDCKQLIKLFYFEKLRRCEVCIEMSISEDQFRRYRRVAIDTIKKIFSVTI